MCSFFVEFSLPDIARPHSSFRSRPKYYLLRENVPAHLTLCRSLSGPLLFLYSMYYGWQLFHLFTHELFFLFHYTVGSQRVIPGNAAPPSVWETEGWVQTLCISKLSLNCCRLKSKNHCTGLQPHGTRDSVCLACYCMPSTKIVHIVDIW